ncbi:MAG TPA: hypothetical protein VJ742_12835 [Nitrososphaera sp.]|nr:hypothetical protein [Nitrososphaera sp.]
MSDKLSREQVLETMKASLLEPKVLAGFSDMNVFQLANHVLTTDEEVVHALAQQALNSVWGEIEESLNTAADFESSFNRLVKEFNAFNKRWMHITGLLDKYLSELQLRKAYSGDPDSGGTAMLERFFRDFDALPPLYAEDDG